MFLLSLYRQVLTVCDYVHIIEAKQIQTALFSFHKCMCYLETASDPSTKVINFFNINFTNTVNNAMLREYIQRYK